MGTKGIGAIGIVGTGWDDLVVVDDVTSRSG
jgi:hypothetical protein